MLQLCPIEKPLVQIFVIQRGIYVPKGGPLLKLFLIVLRIWPLRVFIAKICVFSGNPLNICDRPCEIHGP